MVENDKEMLEDWEKDLEIPDENMVIVNIGKHRFCIDGYLKANYDRLYKEVMFKNYDGFILIVGREGYGKSTLAMQCATYLDPTFNLDRVVFTADQFIEAVVNATKGQAIVFDETMGYLSVRSAMSKFNRSLIKVFSEMRSKNLFIILCIPNFFMMDWYVAEHRSIALLYVKHRGKYYAYDYNTKKKLYIMGKRTRDYCVPPNFWGLFFKYFPLDQNAYEKKKQDAINSFSMEEPKKKQPLSLEN